MSAVGLGDQLDLPASTTDLLILYPEETLNYVAEYADEYVEYCNVYKKGRKSKTSEKEFLKLEHEEGRFMPNVMTADELVQKFYHAYPNLRAYLLRKGEFSKQALHSRTDDPFGRIRFFDEPDFESGWGVIERAGMNFSIQG